jgi:hypothetical protein
MNLLLVLILAALLSLFIVLAVTWAVMERRRTHRKRQIAEKDRT